jgi:hypothetical protein
MASHTEQTPHLEPALEQLGFVEQQASVKKTFSSVYREQFLPSHRCTEPHMVPAALLLLAQSSSPIAAAAAHGRLTSQRLCLLLAYALVWYYKHACSKPYRNCSGAAVV